MRRIIVITVLVVLAGVVVAGAVTRTGVDNAGTGHDPGSVASATLAQNADPGPGRSVRICNDPSGSTARSFSEQVLGATITALEAVVLPVDPSAASAGMPAQPGFELVVRLVSERPLAYGQHYVHVKAPPIPSLPTRPDLSQPGVLDGPIQQWRSHAQNWDTANKEAKAAIDTGRAALQETRLVGGRSSVRDCLAALTRISPQADSKVTYVVASDLQDNGSTSGKTSLGGADVVLIQACPSGNAAKCDRTLDKFTKWLTRSDAGPVTVTSAEAGPDTITRLIGGIS